MSHVVVVGAGYAGVMAANRICAARLPGTRVTVINPTALFVERIRLHQHAAGTAPAVRRLTDLLQPAVSFVEGSVDVIGDDHVVLVGGSIHQFDHLVFAVGSGAPSVPAGPAFAIGSPSHLEPLRQRLIRLERHANVVIIGGSITAIETAAELADRRRDVQLSVITDRVAGWLPERSRDYVRKQLSNRGVKMVEGRRVKTLREGEVRLADGSTVPSHCSILATGFTVPKLATTSGLEVDAIGRLRVDESLVSTKNPRIVGAGDSAVPSGGWAEHVRMSCQAAIPMGAHAADTVISQLRGEQPAPFSVGFVGQALGLGRRSGLIQTTHRDDSPMRLSIRGPVAAAVKELVCRSTIWALRHPAAYRWAPGPVPVPLLQEVKP